MKTTQSIYFFIWIFVDVFSKQWLSEKRQKNTLQCWPCSEMFSHFVWLPNECADFWIYWSSELKLLFVGPVPFLHFYTSLNPWQERGRNAFNHPLYCTTSFLTVRPGQARCFLFYLFRQSFCCLHRQLLPNCQQDMKKQWFKNPLLVQMFNKEPIVGTRVVQPVPQQRWNEQEVSFFIAPAGRLTSSSYLSSQSKYDK